MIPADELEAWAKLYELGHENFDPLSGVAERAITELDLRLKEAYERFVPAKSFPFGKFRASDSADS